MGHFDTKWLLEYFKVKMMTSRRGTSFPLEFQEITRLVSDSRKVQKNTLFIALKGEHCDGRDFIPQAIQAGAVAILRSTDDPSEDRNLIFLWEDDKKVPQISVYNLAEKLSEFADAFYGHPSQKMKVVGVTGTNGKTTVTQLIAQWMAFLDKKVAVLGTIGNGEFGKLSPSANTTPPADITQSYLHDFLSRKIGYTVMEVSSHGLALDRVKGISFAATVFTNLSRDHLDFHETMAEYEQAKWSLFSPVESELAVKSSGKKIINYDDKIGKKWISKLDDVIVVSCSPNNINVIKKLNKPYIVVSDIIYHDSAITIRFESSFGSGEMESRLFGSFNISNLLLAFATMLALDFPFYVLMNTAQHLRPTIGRMEVFGAKEMPTVIVDYAHTPDALDKSLKEAKAHCRGKLWVIFGCGGDRDRGKRPLMGRVAQLHADNIILTNDNPRTEDPNIIINDIMDGFDDLSSISIIPDRKKAIELAINKADKQDIILVAGKGHEDYQIIGEKKRRYSDRKVVSTLLRIKL